MSAADRLKERKSQLDQRWTTLNNKLRALQTRHDVETRIEEKIRLSAEIHSEKETIAEVGAELDQLEKSQAELEERLLGEQLVREARERELKGAFSDALQKWEQVATLGVKLWDAPAQLARLRAVKARADRRGQLRYQLTLRIADLAPIFEDLMSTLSSPSDELGEALESLLDLLLKQQLPAAEFIKAWSLLRSAAAPRPAPALDFAALARRLRNGEIALFLGAELPHQFNDRLPDTRQITAQLASQVQLEPRPASLSAVAEYIEMNSDYGPSALIRELYARLPSAAAGNPLLHLLTMIEAPLLIVSTAHDALLEDAFTRSGKPYVVVSLVISPMERFLPGQLLLRYSDREREEEPCPSSTLSKLEPLESGYSVIFKLRGTCPAPRQQAARELCSLVLSESSHFAFARQLGTSLPDYLGTRLNRRGFWFLGFTPEQWEDRLFAGAILEGRTSREPASVVRSEVTGFEAAYWESRGVRRLAFALPEFVDRLQEAAP